MLAPMNQNDYLSRIKSVCRILRIGCWVALGAIVFVSCAAFWKPENAKVGEIPLSSMLSSHPVFTVTAFGVGALYLALGLILLDRLFRRYEKGEIFVRGTVRYFKWIGSLIFVGTAGSAALKILAFQLGISAKAVDLDLSGFVYGTLVMLIGWIMEQGAALQEEHNLTI